MKAKRKSIEIEFMDVEIPTTTVNVWIQCVLSMSMLSYAGKYTCTLTHTQHIHLYTLTH